MKEWKLTFNPSASKPWEVFTLFNGMKFFKKAYADQLKATKWIKKQEMQIAQPLGAHDKSDENCLCDEVLEASLESFPASDPPAWIKVTAKPPLPKRALYNYQCAQLWAE